MKNSLKRLVPSKKPSPALVISLVALVAAVTGAAWAAIPDSGGVIHGCRTSTGVLKVIDTEASPPDRCTSRQTPISWNQTGPQGLQGDPGAQGDPGPDGPKGPPGPVEAHFAGVASGHIKLSSGFWEGQDRKIDPDVDGSIVLHVVPQPDNITRQCAGTVTRRAGSPQTPIEYQIGFAGLDEVRVYARLAEAPYDPDVQGFDLVVMCKPNAVP